MPDSTNPHDALSLSQRFDAFAKTVEDIVLRGMKGRSTFSGICLRQDSATTTPTSNFE
jgi:hypothetical protein